MRKLLSGRVITGIMEHHILRNFSSKSVLTQGHNYIVVFDLHAVSDFAQDNEEEQELSKSKENLWNSEALSAFEDQARTADSSVL